MRFREQGGCRSAAAVQVSLGVVRWRTLWCSSRLLLLLKLLLLQAPLLLAKLGPPVLEPHLADRIRKCVFVLLNMENSAVV